MQTVLTEERRNKEIITVIWLKTTMERVILYKQNRILYKSYIVKNENAIHLHHTIRKHLLPR